MRKWKTRLETWNKGQKVTVRWIEILRGFLQEDSYSAVGFCIFDIRVCKLPQKSGGNRMGELGNINVGRTLSLFVNDLKQQQESYKVYIDVNEIIVKARHDNGASYRVSKCAEILFEHEKMVRAEELPVFEERMETMDPNNN